MKTSFVAGLALSCLTAGALAAEPARYVSPYEALMAFVAALDGGGPEAVLTVFGPENQELISTGDPGQDKKNRIALLNMYQEGYRFEPQQDGSIVLAFGADAWPFPVPLARTGDSWAFDAAAGYDEVLNREIGGNELEVIDLVDAYGDVQAAFRLTDYDDDGIMEFARQIIATPGTRDGLYWPGPDSPLGERLARASADGFSDGEQDFQPEPYSGYYFRILTGQTDAAPGGAMSYMVNDDMLAGHALLAVPADYGISGVHSFMVSENGLILQADLGENTLEIARDMLLYDPSETWSPVQ
ncbi:DUF2950 family protein [Sedimentitalea nanhaiensis]|uniref:DUF2950 domain-containing protein n=1 Tax=Sedimentitalea nanhaiensis TaxID=999627 RepID=A0A1I7B8Q2_9RHOB|nr:DUF2950 family protein [Sedimentitalea nanhaiensis]SFT83534.1 Protein of unknown function [Sedimentitalea nanhaiensis]